MTPIRLQTRYSTWGGSRGNRLAPELYPAGTPVHLIVCTASGRRLFWSRPLAEPAFELCASWPETLACCLMPDHLHWLLADARRMSESVRRYKGAVSHLLHRQGVRGAVWQRSFWDHVLRSREDLATVARYIVENPVRAGLAASVEEYPFQMVRLEEPSE